ncbi:MAG: TIR domain-containing protein [Deltaproteobacteria bacterium]|nr:TIR domain-containing protein [Deltaproteobacteria bacterium]
MTRRVFYSFHYAPDNWRASQVRNIGVIEGNRPATDNDWESVTRGGDRAIEKWIADQMYGRSCTVVLVGANTAGRKWINYEIIKSWNDEKGVVGIRIHGLRNREGKISKRGLNPFDVIDYGNSGKKLSSIVKCYDPRGQNSRERYDWIQAHLANAVEEAIAIRDKH